VSRWAELVFHVLAHVRASPAASAFDPVWIDYAAKHLGPARERHLAEDAEILARAAATHDALAEVQLLAWLFHDASRAAACSDRTLAELSAADVDDAAILARLRGNGAAEILRAAAELEADAFAELPALVADGVDYDHRLAPWLARFTIASLRPLRIRGRVRGELIFVGVPCRELEVRSEHVAWQAAHEATVAEVHERARRAPLPVTHNELEHTALVLLAERARAAGKSAEHAAWIGHFAHVPILERAELDPRWRALI